MNSPPKTQTTIIRTERGLSIAGTRITLYDVMDYLTASYPPKLIREKLCLTDEQVKADLSYIEANRAQVEAEYQEVLQIAEENRQYRSSLGETSGTESKERIGSMSFLIDHNFEGHAVILLGNIANQGLLALLPIRFVTLRSLGYRLIVTIALFGDLPKKTT